MSVQFGRWSFAGASPEREYMEKVSACIAPYGPDSGSSYSRPGIEILYRGFHTTKEARREKQPHACASGAVITWDGRLDNRDELIDELRPRVSLEDSDVTLVGTAFDNWGTECFAKLVGDWALSIWDTRQRSLILAKDPIGPRHLYYSVEDEQITWCTVLDPLVLLAGKKFKLCEEYLAGWLSLYPATQLTPYVGIQAVSPATCVFLGPRKHIVAKYWDFDPDKRIRYRTDAEYEEHFRSVFFQAVRRRLRSDAPILAELSGGRDSSSIVCVADEIITRGQAQTPRLDTISYYDDSEPNWNERPYLAKVEAHRHRIGWHINVQNRASDEVRLWSAQGLVPNPGYSSVMTLQLGMCLQDRGNRIVLSGNGGDEVMGGVPSPVPELQDLLVCGSFGGLARQLRAWALQKQEPWFYLLAQAISGFVSSKSKRLSKTSDKTAWLCPDFSRRYALALTGYRQRTRLFGSPPSFQDNVYTLEGLRRQLAAKALDSECLYEKAYPYLDRYLLEFLFAIPRDQSVRPTQRRSLMRRALSGIVPAEVLNRPRKATISRAPLMGIAEAWSNLVKLTDCMATASLGVVEATQFRVALQQAKHGEEPDWLRLTRTIHVEQWLQNLLITGVLTFENRAEPNFRSQAPAIVSDFPSSGVIEA